MGSVKPPAERSEASNVPSEARLIKYISTYTIKKTVAKPPAERSEANKVYTNQYGLNSKFDVVLTHQFFKNPYRSKIFKNSIDNKVFDFFLNIGNYRFRATNWTFAPY